jgi:hypothetical protein
MSDLALTAEQKTEREERFRYVDLSHPLMQMLFNLQLANAVQQAEETA